MELDDFKRAPLPDKGSYENAAGKKPDNLDNFIEELKQADIKDRKKARMFIIVMIMFLVIYTPIMMRYQGMMKDGFAMIVMGFALILVYLFRRYRKIRKIDYSAPTVKFLKETAERLSFMRPADWFISIPLLFLLITGGGLVVYASFLKYFGTSPWPLTIYLIVISAAVAVGFWSGIKIWKKDKGGIVDKIRKMQEEFGG